MSLKECKLLYVRICIYRSWYQKVKAECVGGGNAEQWFFFCKETDGKHLNNSWRSNWFFWLEGLAPFDLSSPEEKLINTEVRVRGCVPVRMCAFWVHVHAISVSIFIKLLDISYKCGTTFSSTLGLEIQMCVHKAKMPLYAFIIIFRHPYSQRL